MDIHGRGHTSSAGHDREDTVVREGSDDTEDIENGA